MTAQKEAPVHLAILGGSGFYKMDGISDGKEYYPETPWGKPSAPILVGSLVGKKVAFLARHGIGHHILPEEVNYRANIFALKHLGVREIIALNACGSLREEISPGDMVIPDQIFDHTHGRPSSFFGDGMVAHVGVAEPYCSRLSAAVEKSVRSTGVRVHRGGNFLVIQGPRFSTRAESETYRLWGMTIIGMTAAPEAFLAREAGICYSTIAHVTDYDVWHQDRSPVSVEMVVKTLHQNARTIDSIVKHLIENHTFNLPCSCQDSLQDAIITDARVVPAATQNRLEALIKKPVK